MKCRHVPNESNLSRKKYKKYIYTKKININK